MNECFILMWFITRWCVYFFGVYDVDDMVMTMMMMIMMMSRDDDDNDNDGGKVSDNEVITVLVMSRLLTSAIWSLSCQIWPSP